MSETRKKKYVMPTVAFIKDNKIQDKPIYDKAGNEIKTPIDIKNREDLEKEGYIVIKAETTKTRDEGRDAI